MVRDDFESFSRRTNEGTNEAKERRSLRRCVVVVSLCCCVVVSSLCRRCVVVVSLLCRCCVVVVSLLCRCCVGVVSLCYSVVHEKHRNVIELKLRLSLQQRINTVNERRQEAEGGSGGRKRREETEESSEGRKRRTEAEEGSGGRTRTSFGSRRRSLLFCCALGRRQCCVER